MKKIVSISAISPDPSLISKTAEILQNGGLVAFPTDTHYGLAVNPFNARAVERLFKIKGRPADNPIILLISGRDMLDGLITETSAIAKTIMDKFWPGPLTLIFNKTRHVPDRLSAGKQTIGIRYPKADISIHLIRASGFPLTATSANRSGQATGTTAKEIEKNLGRHLDLILDAGCCEGLPSTIVDLAGHLPKILREGRLPGKRLESFFLKQRPQI